jgi:hypothetical protein
MSIARVVLEPSAVERIVDSVMPRNASDVDKLALSELMKAYNLNPLCKEIYAISYGGRLSVVVGVDGWRRLAHETGRYQSSDVRYGEDEHGEYCTFTVHTTLGGQFSFTCWLHEFKQSSPTWNKSPRHMLRIKAEVHCLKAAFGLAGPTEYEVEAEATSAGAEVVQTSGLAALNARLANTKPASASTVALEGTPEVLPSADSQPPAVSLGELAERVAQLAREMGSARYTWQKAMANARKVVGDDDAQVRTYLESLIQRGEEQKATRKEASNG